MTAARLERRDFVPAPPGGLEGTATVDREWANQADDALAVKTHAESPRGSWITMVLEDNGKERERRKR